MRGDAWCYTRPLDTIHENVRRYGHANVVGRVDIPTSMLDNVIMLFRDSAQRVIRDLWPSGYESEGLRVRRVITISHSKTPDLVHVEWEVYR